MQKLGNSKLDNIGLYLLVSVTSRQFLSVSFLSFLLVLF